MTNVTEDDKGNVYIDDRLIGHSGDISPGLLEAWDILLENQQDFIGITVIAQTGDGPLTGKIVKTDKWGVTLQCSEYWFESVTWECLYAEPRKKIEKGCHWCGYEDHKSEDCPYHLK